MQAWQLQSGKWQHPCGVGTFLDASGGTKCSECPDLAGPGSTMVRAASIEECYPEVAFSYLSYHEIVELLHQLASDYPELVEVFTTEEHFGLSSPGTCWVNRAIRDCETYVIRITNKALEASDTPELFLSGAIHCDEPVGAVVVTEFVTLLLQMYVQGNAWAKRLVNSRAVTIVPAANALGYAACRREENHIDPNRDFAWNQREGMCMQTVAAQSINELWRHHIFQLSLTFHGGDEMLGFPWGDVIHCCTRSSFLTPDNTAMAAIADAAANYVGDFGSGHKYPTGIINDLSYLINGPFEDWGYAASWSPSGSVQCTGGESSGYQPSATVYNNATHRAANFLVETSFSKMPRSADLGTNKSVISAGGGGQAGDCHISRNIRLCWFMLDLLQPWVTITNVEAMAPTPEEGEIVCVDWEVGGALTVDEAVLECLPDESMEPDLRLCSAGSISSHSIWDTDGTAHRNMSAALTLADGATVSRIRVRVRVRVDQVWASDERAESFQGPPQSHVVRARTDEGWHAENREGSGAEVRGRLLWHSQEVSLRVLDPNQP